MIIFHHNIQQHHRTSVPFAQVLAPLAILLIILRIFPILSWTILTSIGVHLLLARLQGVVVGKEVLFLELVLAFLAALPLGLFRNPLLLLCVLFSLLFVGVCALLRDSQSGQRSQEPQEAQREVKPKVEKVKKKEEESNLKNKRDVEAEQLAKQSKQLEALAMMENEDFAEAILKTFPPVHLPSAKWDTLDLKDIKMESLLKKLVSLYHPDKVDKVKNGEKYYVLCEMITAQLNVRYSKYK